MNWLFLVQNCVAGLLAGFISWLVYRGGNPWDIIDNFLTGIMTSSMFCSIFAGLVSSFPIIIKEFKLKKAINYFISAFVVCFSITALTSVVYSMLMENLINSGNNIPISVLRFFWWLLLAISLACTFGFLHNSIKVLCKTLMGFTPSFIITGALIDKLFIIDNRYMLSFIFMGFMLGLGFSIAWELLKEAWLDEYKGFGITFRYYIDESDFSAGSSLECDLTLQEGPEVLFFITEKDSVHVFELQDTDFRACVNNSKFRYRQLVDGDVLTVLNRHFIYHSVISHVKDEMPELS